MAIQKTGRTERLIVPVTANERKLVKQWAKEARLNDSDYVRSKLSLSLARGSRNRYEKAPVEPPGDPENAVDVEELAKEIYKSGVWTKADARRQAKRRLEVAAAEKT